MICRRHGEEKIFETKETLHNEHVDPMRRNRREVDMGGALHPERAGEFAVDELKLPRTARPARFFLSA